MKRISWNVNGLRACLTKGFTESMKELDADRLLATFLRETEHDMATSENSEKGYHSGKHWRHGSWFAYTLDPKGAKKNMAIEATYWGGDSGRAFAVIANGVVLKTVKSVAFRQNEIRVVGSSGAVDVLPRFVK